MTLRKLMTYYNFQSYEMKEVGRTFYDTKLIRIYYTGDNIDNYFELGINGFYLNNKKIIEEVIRKSILNKEVVSFTVENDEYTEPYLKVILW